MSSPVLWGPNNTANNLQNQQLLANGTLIAYNGPKNYISYCNFENNLTTGWSLGTVGTLTNGLPTGTPTFGSGASANLSIATTSSAIEGLYSLQLISSTATTQGNMLATQTYTIDSEDQAKVLTVTFYYNPSSGSSNCNFSGTSSNSFAWAVYDVTNSSWLTSTGNFNFTQSSGSGYVTGTIQTNSNTSSIRLVIYNANATSGAATLTLDGFYVGPQGSSVAVASVNMSYNGTSGQTITSGSTSTVLYSTKIRDTHNAFNTGTGVYTVPVSGMYLINAQGCTSSTSANGNEISVYHNGSMLAGGPYSPTVNTVSTPTISFMYPCSAGDTLQIEWYNPNSGSIVVQNSAQCFINIARLGS